MPRKPARKVAPRLNASLQQRSKGGAWFVVYRDHTDGGKQKRQPCLTDAGDKLTDRAAAEQFLKAWLQHRERVGTGLVCPFKEASDRLLSPIMSDYLSDRQTDPHRPVGAKRLQALKRDCERAILAMRAGKLADLTPDKINGWLRAEATDHTQSHKTINGFRDSVNGFCEWLVVKKLIQTNPIGKRTVPRVSGKGRKRTVRKAALSVRELRQLVQACLTYPTAAMVHRGGGRPRADGTPARTAKSADLTPDTARKLTDRGVMLSLTYRVAMATGLRHGELAALTPTSLKGNRLYLAGDHQKVHFDGMSVFVLPRGLADELAQHQPGDGRLLLINPDPAGWSKHHARLLKHAGLDKTNHIGEVRTFHGLRKSVRGVLERKGCTPTAVKRYMRHAAVGVTESNYSEVGSARPCNDGKVSKIVAKLDRFVTQSDTEAEPPAAIPFVTRAV